MSTYQYYEFQALDRPLTPKEQEVVSRLSSRVEPHPRRAIFVYHYGDFRGDPIDILAKYYDAFFYIANWGNIELAFRFPKGLIDTEQLDPYWVEDVLTWEVIDNYLVLQLHWENEDGFGWTEGDGYLDSLLPLRDALIHGDYRLLYLAWLSALNGWRVDEESIEPPIPPNLNQLTPSLQAFAELFQVDKHLITAAAQEGQTGVTAVDWSHAIVNLSREEANQWLLRLANGQDPHLSVAFQRALQGNTVTKETSKGGRRAEQLLILAEETATHARQIADAEAEAQRIRDLQALAPKAEAQWIFAEQLMTQTNARAYDEATQILHQLHQLAQYQGTEPAFATRMAQIRERYPRRKALIARFNKLGLP